MSNANRHDIHVLNTLIQTAIDSADGYREASTETENPGHRDLFGRRSFERRQVAEPGPRPAGMFDHVVPAFRGEGIRTDHEAVGEILERHDLVVKRRKHPAAPVHPGQPIVPMDAPNSSWTVDFKGHFRMLNGKYCYPLTVQDSFSRCLLCCEALPSTSVDDAKPIFARLFREYGLPDYFLSDNGSPFASIGLGRLTRLRAWWIRLGIQHLTIQPGEPQQNPRHERMHRDLKREATRPPQANFTAQQRHFDDFRHTFNHIRPHEALGDETPASVYTPSTRIMPRALAPLEYPAHFEVRKVSTNGGIRWETNWVNVSSVIPGEPVGLEPVGPNTWQVYYGPVTLGWLDETTLKITDIEQKTGRNPKTYD